MGEGKSIDIESFLPLLKLNTHFDFINLQYGDIKFDITKFEEKTGRKLIYFDKLTHF